MLISEMGTLVGGSWTCTTLLRANQSRRLMQPFFSVEPVSSSLRTGLCTRAREGEFGQMINYLRGAELEVWEETLW